MKIGIDQALLLAQSSRERSIEELRAVVRIPSLTGEEGPAQQHLEGKLRALGADVSVAEPDVAAMFERFPGVAQYPTHWQHDLILPYAELPTYEALKGSGLESETGTGLGETCRASRAARLNVNRVRR